MPPGWGLPRCTPPPPRKGYCSAVCYIRYEVTPLVDVLVRATYLLGKCNNSHIISPSDSNRQPFGHKPVLLTLRLLPPLPQSVWEDAPNEKAGITLRKK